MRGSSPVAGSTVRLVVVVSYRLKRRRRCHKNNCDDDVAGARRLECGGASGKFTPRSSGEADRHCATESLGGLTAEDIVE